MTTERWLAIQRSQPPPRMVVSGGNVGPPYVSCSHQGCYRKVNSRKQVDDHDCCGSAKHNTTHAYWERDGKPWGRR